MLYALRYEKHSNNDLTGLVQALERRGVPEKKRKVRAQTPDNSESGPTPPTPNTFALQAAGAKFYASSELRFGLPQ